MSPAIVKPVPIAEGAFTRASVAWYFDAAGTLQQAAANVLRTGYDPATLAYGVTFEPNAATNEIQNNTMVGAAAGTPGVDPTRWAGSWFTVGGLTRTVVGTGTEDGIAYIDYRINGVPAAAGLMGLGFEGTAAVNAAAGQTWVHSAFFRLTAGTLAGIAGLSIKVAEHTAAGAWLADSGAAVALSNDALRTGRASVTRAFSNAGTARVFPYMELAFDGAAVDMTLRIGLPQLERDRLSSQIRTTNAGAITRAADTLASGMVTDIAENDHAAWSGAATYAAGDRVISTATHKIYQSLQAANTNNDPTSAANATWWSEVSPTNRWKPFDVSNSTQAVKAGTMSFVIKPGAAINAIAALNASATSVRKRVVDPADGVVFDRTFSLVGTIPGATWFDYFFGTVTPLDKAVALDVPPYAAGTVLVDFYAATGNVLCGVLMMGYQVTVGDGIRYGATAGIQDYSRKEKNAWGDTVLVQRAYADRFTFSMPVPNTQIDALKLQLAAYRATACLWVGYQPLALTTVFGFYSDFEISIAYATYSDCSMTIEGMA